ncbi:NUDIX domain-containing protein [Deinococcus deserti]|uniref:Putative NUDIX hydrolase n=1 Tax=Deinococcus deserti (strain DSM 17065 / CIP 109153 / LMG 22923 / VCD115) TaxID=546414 RepID=C1CWH8_DEIDV|nr:NUDIX domain-containing protein [Deinococcus deserti]ACO46545.1 putative NUDIX hydrolase [Deinococcus deserti VCD115]
MSFVLVAWLVVQDPVGRVLLGRRSGVTYAEGLWGLPGGRVERGEALAQAAVREAAEEVGLRVDPGQLEPLGAARYDLGEAHGVDFLFLTRTWEGEPAPLENTSEVGWFHPGALPPESLPWLADVLDTHLRRGVWLCEHLKQP